MALISSAAVGPGAVVAQSSDRVRRVGILANEPWPPLEGLREGLQGLGYVEGNRCSSSYRFAAGQAERFSILAAELVHSAVDVIVTVGTPASLAAKHATSPRSRSSCRPAILSRPNSPPISPARAGTSQGCPRKLLRSRRSDCNCLRSCSPVFLGLPCCRTPPILTATSRWTARGAEPRP